jgi:hypothetical protein
MCFENPAVLWRELLASVEQMPPRGAFFILPLDGGCVTFTRQSYLTAVFVAVWRIGPPQDKYLLITSFDSVLRLAQNRGLLRTSLRMPIFFFG